VPCFFGTIVFSVSPSIGIAEAPFHDRDAAGLIGAATEALSAARAAGGHVWRIAEAIPGGFDAPATPSVPRCGSVAPWRHGARATIAGHDETSTDDVQPASLGVLNAAVATGMRALGRVGIAMAILLNS